MWGGSGADGPEGAQRGLNATAPWAPGVESCVFAQVWALGPWALPCATCSTYSPPPLPEAIASFENIIPLFYRDIGEGFSFQDFYCANLYAFNQIKHELTSELKWAADRKMSGAHGIDFDELLTLNAPFEVALTKPESNILCDYESGGFGKDICCMLNQKPSAGRQIHSSGNYMHTIISNPSLHFCTKKDCLANQKKS